jgi:hypothetical protein
MFTLSNLSASPLFWETFWPAVSFGALAVTCLATLAWSSAGRHYPPSRGGRSP